MLFQVMETIEGYFDIVWAEVDIEAINAELTEFQNRYAIDISIIEL